jgi:hypothetical protein
MLSHPSSIIIHIDSFCKSFVLDTSNSRLPRLPIAISFFQMNSKGAPWLDLVTLAISSIVASVVIHIIWRAFEGHLMVSPFADRSIAAIEGEAHAAAWCALPLVNHILEPFIPNIGIRRHELSIILILAICCPFVQTVVCYASHIGSAHLFATNFLEVCQVHCGFMCTRLGSLFTENLIAPLFRAPQSSQEHFVTRHLRFYFSPIGGAITKALLFSLASPTPFAQSVANHMGTAQSYFGLLLKLSIIIDLRLVYEAGFHYLIEACESRFSCTAKRRAP